MPNLDREKVETPYTVRWWGEKCTCAPKLVEEALGDGSVVVGIQPLNTRPHYYVLRVDSRWHLDGCPDCASECEHDIVEHLEEILEAIEEEWGMGGEVAAEQNEHLDGEELLPEGWPAADFGDGVSWFRIDDCADWLPGRADE